MRSWLNLLSERVLSTQLTLGSGTPLTPVIPAPVSSAGVTGSLRTDVEIGGKKPVITFRKSRDF